MNTLQQNNTESQEETLNETESQSQGQTLEEMGIQLQKDILYMKAIGQMKYFICERCGQGYGDFEFITQMADFNNNTDEVFVEIKKCPACERKI